MSDTDNPLIGGDCLICGKIDCDGHAAGAPDGGEAPPARRCEVCDLPLDTQGWCEVCNEWEKRPVVPVAALPETPPEAGTPDWPRYRGSLRVIAEMRNLLQSSHVADRPMLEHWVALLLTELDDELRAKIPAMEAQLAALEQAKRIFRATLDFEITL